MSDESISQETQQNKDFLTDLQHYASIQYASSDLGRQTHLMALRNTIAYAAIAVQNNPIIPESEKTPAMMSALTAVLIGDPKQSSSGLAELRTAYDNRNEGAYNIRSALGFREPNLLNFAGDSGFAPQYFDTGKPGFQTQHALAGVLAGYQSYRSTGHDGNLQPNTALGMAANIAGSIAAESASGATATVLHYTERLKGTKPDAKLYDKSVPLGADLAAGRVHRLQLADSLVLATGDDERRELARQGLENLTKSTPSQISQALATNTEFSLTERPTIGHSLDQVLPQNLQSMLGGSDDLGTRNDIDHITIAPSGIKPGDNANNLRLMAAQFDAKSFWGKPHMLILEDGTVQGPADGGVPFNQNAPFDRRGRKSDGLAVMYAGNSEPNPLQKQAIGEIETWLQTQRNAAGYTGAIRVEGNGPEADKLLRLQPSPQISVRPQQHPQMSSPGATP